MGGRPGERSLLRGGFHGPGLINGEMACFEVILPRLLGSPFFQAQAVPYMFQKDRLIHRV
jgi:hypothetical protein